MAKYSIVPLSNLNNRKSFHSGSKPLDEYFKKQVTQDIRRSLTKCFVAVDGALRVVGFYTLSASHILLSDLPPEVSRKLPKIPIPVARVGRLTIDNHCQGQRLDGALLFDAMMRATQTDIGVYAVIVDAKDEHAAGFYEHFGFIPFPDSPRTLFFPIKRVKSVLSR